MQYRSTLNNVDWLNENEEKLRSIFPDTWTHLGNVTDVQLLYKLKLLSVPLSHDHVGDFMAFMEESGVIHRQGNTIRSCREPVLFAKGFFSEAQPQTEETKDDKATKGQHVRYVRKDSHDLFIFLFLFWWTCGIVIAKGFWSTLISIFFPPWAMYVSVERFLEVFKVIPV